MSKKQKGKSEVVLMHVVDHWLGLTLPWLFDAVYYLPTSIKKYVVCKNKINQEYFSIPEVYAVDEQSSVKVFLDKVLRKLKIRRSWGLLMVLARRFDVNVMHSHFGDMAWKNVPVCEKLGIKHVVSFYGHDVDRLPLLNKEWPVRYQSLFDSVDKVLCLGPFMKDRLQQRGCPEEKIEIHSLGIRVDDIPFKMRSWNKSEVFRILIASSFLEKKGIPYALEAIGQLQKELPIEVTIIGGASREERSKKEEAKILACINDCSLSDNVRLLGYQSRDVLHEEAYKHHLFLAPSVTASDGDSEGTPVTLMEMAATGMPIVSTKHSDIPHVIKDGETGFLAEERSVEDLVVCLRNWIDREGSWSSMLNAGRQHIETNFHANKQSEALANIYLQVLK